MTSQEKVLLYLWVDIQLLTYEVERLENDFGIENKIDFSILEKGFREEIIKQEDFTKRLKFMDKYRGLLLLSIMIIEGLI